jgi:hypothetical protein
MIEFQALTLFHSELTNYLSDLKSFSSLHGSSSANYFPKVSYRQILNCFRVIKSGVMVRCRRFELLSW